MSQHRNLWAPWRIDYIKGLTGDAPEPAESSEASGGCFLCDAVAAEGEAAQADRLVLRRDDRGVLLLNRYPYTNGHLLVAPPAHLPGLTDMTPAQRAGLMELCDLGVRLLDAVMNPQGVNLGMNLGRCAGAGVPGHAHMHVVPRWNGDVNFMHVVAGVRVIPEALEESYRSLKEALGKSF